jgi:starch synthase (maltosyl-transferring)
MPDDQVINPVSQGSQKPAMSAGSTGRSEFGPVLSQDAQNKVVAKSLLSPSIYDLTAVLSQDIVRGIERASVLRFNSILVGSLEDEVLEVARSKDLRVILDVDMARTDDNELIEAHPEWFVNSEAGIRFVYLSNTDGAVDWWSDRISSFAGEGVSGFMCRNAAETPAFVWRQLIGDARVISDDIDFFAFTCGADPQRIAGLNDCGFSFSVSSSCWWDYSAGWLNDDSKRLTSLAPPIAFVLPPHSSFTSAEPVRRRALALAAIFGAGWLMPAGFEQAADYDLTDHVIELNELRGSKAELQSATPARVVSSPGAKLTLLDRGQSLLLALNPSLVFSANLGEVNNVIHPFDTGTLYFKPSAPKLPVPIETVIIPPAGLEIFEVRADAPIVNKKKSSPDCGAARIAIENIAPKIEDGQFPVRRIVGETLTVEADILADGHDKIAAEVIFKPVSDSKWQSRLMENLGNDRWQAKIPLQRLGRYSYAIRAWRDTFATFADEVTKKSQAGQNIHIELLEGVALLERTASANLNKSQKFLTATLAQLTKASDDLKTEILLSAQVKDWMRAGDLREFLVESEPITVDAERIGARFANWYEVFPRSQSGDPDRHGTFLDTIEQLPRIADMGFDVLYFPPIHPIGRVNRKGKNNTLSPAETDPGSPYAIGNEHGGHDAIHPELGTFEDFQALRRAAGEHGIEIALDFAIQCAPDHPWLKQHKEWFDWRPDGSIKYAENPPKKYEDIVNIDFYAEGAKPALWVALRDIVQFWVDQGIKLFRVDNPHTKPFPFWEWMIKDVRQRHPEVVFLAEAFTRPKLMYRLAKIGFSQSYTYFTWRNTKYEITEYLTELTQTKAKEFFRPHFFVNTPDINPVFLQQSGRPGFLIRAALAATLSGLWGVYNGFELCEAAAIPGKEEYLDSEKYQIRTWKYDQPNHIIDEISRLNKIRRDNAALHSHLGIKFHNAYDEQVIFFSKSSADGNYILVAISLDPFHSRETTLELPLYDLGIPDDGALFVEDLMRDFKFTWYGKYQPVTLHPDQPFCIWRVQSAIS